MNRSATPRGPRARVQGPRRNRRLLRRLLALGPCTLALLFTVGCHSHPHDGAEQHDHGHASNQERPTLSFTHWTDASELFLELPALVRGEESPCAAHLTQLEGFRALAEGQVEVVLRSATGEQRFESSGPSVPGIFRPVVRPSGAGAARLIVVVRSPDLAAEHDLGEVTVFENIADATAAALEEPEGGAQIPFLKEQQWPISFGTAVVTEQWIRPTLRAFGRIVARPDHDVLVTASVAGRIDAGDRSFPRIGAVLELDDPLALLLPRLDSTDLASLELALQRARLESDHAAREQRRLADLRQSGAVPERRLQDAVHATKEAQASLEAARRRLEQFRRVPRAAGTSDAAVSLRAPLQGTITEVHVAPGSYVEAGAPLFRVTDVRNLLLEVDVAEADVGRVGTVAGGSFRVDGIDEPIELASDGLVSRGVQIDPRSRTLPLWYAIDTTSRPLLLGASAQVLLAIGEARAAIAVPESALVEDGGPFVVFVQVGGETFERRVARLGVRDRGLVEVLSGVQRGEHVVTRGAWSLKLAMSSSSVPAHGHAH